MTTIEQLRSLRESLPKGNKDPWGNDKNKRVLLQRALRKESIGELTIGEYAAVQKFVEFASQLQQDRERDIKQLEKTIQKLAQQ